MRGRRVATVRRVRTWDVPVIRRVNVMARGALCFTMLLAAATPAFSQTHSEAWLSARFIVDKDRTWSQDVPIGVGGGFALGAFVTRHVGVEVALEWPFAETAVHVFTGPAAVSVGGFLRNTRTDTTRSAGGIGAAAFRVVSRATLSMTVLAGFGIVSHRSKSDSRTEYLDADGNVTRQSEAMNSSRYFWGGLATGVEVAARIADHVAVVPEVHVIFFPLSETGTLIIRPAVGIRWTD